MRSLNRPSGVPSPEKNTRAPVGHVVAAVVATAGLAPEIPDTATLSFVFVRFGPLRKRAVAAVSSTV